MSQTESPLIIHRPMYIRANVRVCHACQVVWPCLIAKAQVLRAMRDGDQASPGFPGWWMIPKPDQQP
jgi:hypothetical protein